MVLKMATYNIRNFKQLESYMNRVIRKCLIYCAGRTEMMLRRLLEERLYDFEPVMYERTYELLNSITQSEVVKLSNGTYYVEIYYDTDKIRAYPRENDGLSYKWGQHTSFDGEDVSEFIPLWIEKGTNNPYYSHKGTDSMEDTKKWIEQEYNRLFKIYLKRMVGSIE